MCWFIQIMMTMMTEMFIGFSSLLRPTFPWSDSHLSTISIQFSLLLRAPQAVKTPPRITKRREIFHWRLQWGTESNSPIFTSPPGGLFLTPQPLINETGKLDCIVLLYFVTPLRNEFCVSLDLILQFMFYDDLPWLDTASMFFFKQCWKFILLYISLLSHLVDKIGILILKLLYHWKLAHKVV